MRHSFCVVHWSTNYRVITSIGVESNDYYAQHKIHIGKKLYIVVTTFILIENDIKKGGTEIQICFVIADNIVEGIR